METYQIAKLAADALLNKKANDVVIIDLRDKASFADYFVLASANTDRASNSLVDEVEDKLAEQEVFPRNIEGRGGSGWILMDYGDLLVSVFNRDMRDKFNIEKVWGDCEITKLEE